MPTDPIEQIVATAFDADVRTRWQPKSGSVAETTVVELENARGDVPQRLVCKRGGASVWTGDVIEPAVLELLEQRSELPVPSVLAFGDIVDETGTAREADPLERWACYEYLEGTNPGPRYATLEPAVRRRLVADAGAHLGRLHGMSELEFERVGGLARGENGTDLVLREPAGWHAVDSDTLREQLPISVPPAGGDDRRPVLTHGDYQPSNLLVDDSGAITAVLDWGNAHVTHAEYALARAEIRFVDGYAGRLSRGERRRLRAAFRASYARHAPLEAGFGRRAPLEKLRWVVQSGSNYARLLGEDRGRRQLWRQCRRLLE
ncbi:phosphotransferase family protein [Natronorubrum daqingense]|uniref:Aminoglycoside phosphotransferase n=1 Tax=Natronorubrum daqingense TaxID=588898 RepID=A0A1N7EPG7_9EURY|nr:phosphotransferase [Natronorubrum daqingense]APX98283.1 aminoglycoside phosphotransferase [Natronorubrum daqingense]SIR89956.1 Phosphotransferase enzyme family protein [Natronorubrum daqingense]